MGRLLRLVAGRPDAAGRELRASASRRTSTAWSPARPLSNSRYRYHSGGQTDADVQAELKAADGYLKAAKHLMVDGMFNVNSTSVAAWHALFAGIRERQLGFPRQQRRTPGDRCPLRQADRHLALQHGGFRPGDGRCRSQGVTMPDGSQGWSGVRFLDDDQLQKLAEECVKQVKQRGPFLNFSEFINRRLSNDELGLMGALQSAIDYDDEQPGLADPSTTASRQAPAS